MSADTRYRWARPWAGDELFARRGTDPDTVKVLDFGLVRAIDRKADGALTQDGALVGTPLYMAPEMILSGDNAGPRADIYALGAVGYFLLTGTHVFAGANLVELCAHHLHTEPQPIADRLGEPVADDLAQVIMKCLAKRPEDRPESAAALIEELHRCEHHGDWTTEDASTWWKRNRDALNDSSARQSTSNVTRMLPIAAP